MRSVLSLLSIWVRATCSGADARRDILAKAFEAEDANRNCHFLIGAGLTRSRRACLLHCHGGELFVFELTHVQAAQAGAQGATMSFSLHGPALAPDESPFHLETVDIENAATLSRSEPIRGRCTCFVEASWVEGACLQLEVALRTARQPDQTRRHSLFFYPAPLLQGEATIAFEFPAVSKPDNADPPAAGQTVAAFLRFCRPPDPARGQHEVPLSNALGVLVTFI